MVGREVPRNRSSNEEEEELEQKNAVKRQLALNRFKTISQAQFTLAAVLLICGIIGVDHYNPEAITGTPYFVFCFTVSPLLIVAAIFGHLLRRRGKQFGTNDAVTKQVHTALRGIHVTSPCLIIVSLIGVSAILKSSSVSGSTCQGCVLDSHRVANNVLSLGTTGLLGTIFIHSSYAMLSLLILSDSFGYSNRHCGSADRSIRERFNGVVCRNRSESDVTTENALTTQIVARYENSLTELRQENEQLRRQLYQVQVQFEQMQQQQQLQQQQQQQQQQPQQEPSAPYEQPPPSYADVIGQRV